MELDKNKKLEVIKFLKSPDYQKLVKKYNNSYEQDVKYFEAKYEGEEKYEASEATKSELDMHIQKLNFFKDKLADVGEGIGEGADYVRELIESNITNVKSHLYNAVTNGFGMSKDVKVHTEDDLRKFLMLHKKDFHIMIVSFMFPEKEFDSMDEKYKIYNDPEEYLE